MTPTTAVPVRQAEGVEAIEDDARWPLLLMGVLALIGAVLVAAMMLAQRDRAAGAAGPTATPAATPAATGERSVSARPSPGPPARRPARSVTPAHPATATSILSTWDRRRARAWGSGDVADLRRLYVAGSPAGRNDVTMLRDWLGRGARLQGLRMQLLSVRELRRTPSTLVLRVTDRVARGTVVADGVRRRLPTDRATTRTLRLEHRHGTWRMAGQVRG